ncbi:hypothetical protein PHYBLDRAFT_70104 [Phycomyces blakesleeanus NRRL 1555(-)]|uniref:Uncharacterized protein n=1 Tax=Phycomyces blakesleeanus (strain ATCC 8743b / DSM 1359 / FGSC 10004 / NBRC 33097 / NRRL 1555) TaxID=763407 RepID=A0A162TWN1_PHYB8|nr:hypothetical protein PHYBLDRAFT_70104 [Phycomyces blakesleeanus NRRL 1555(-)]OAD71562.1 hypothetical protein PHYBLDRAFT_70104 [Phycomyces blakesleeanus NRRL 1555(-)]|eukprot:XP_018289602.1 hypothetical protein PHYBLDRAFT_70104 [Phycomyces blakesleeanus NRRL 1555(-)]
MPEFLYYIIYMRGKRKEGLFVHDRGPVSSPNGMKCQKKSSWSGETSRGESKLIARQYAYLLWAKREWNLGKIVRFMTIIRFKPEDFGNNLGFPYKAFTIKLPLNTVVNNEYKELLRNKIIITLNDLHNIISRAMMFINSYCLVSSRDSIPSYIYNQTFWYSVCQLVNGRKIRDYIYRIQSKPTKRSQPMSVRSLH